MEGLLSIGRKFKGHFFRQGRAHILAPCHDFPNGAGPTGVPIIRHEGTIPGFRAVYWRLPKHGITVIVLTNLDRAALDNLTAGIAVRYVPELLPAYQKRWPAQASK